MTELGPPYKSGHHRKITDSFSKAISNLEKLISTNLILKELTHVYASFTFFIFNARGCQLICQVLLSRFRGGLLVTILHGQFQITTISEKTDVVLIHSKEFGIENGIKKCCLNFIV